MLTNGIKVWIIGVLYKVFPWPIPYVGLPSASTVFTGIFDKSSSPSGFKALLISAPVFPEDESKTEATSS